uniref:Uncharacterized protein n=1 Tax=Nelumbo nucifera TaxID=4432 RepID=A0A822XNQ4_NELNU|nr:TPA_asm: hypothetical protein HUJ06_023380 [Nelumbo nucifera]
MTKQNVVVPDVKSGINDMITVVPNASLFPSAGQKPPAAPGGYIGISRKKFLKKLETGGGAKVNPWVDSMKVSSPTHAKSTPSLSPNVDQIESWIVSITSVS